MIKHFAWINSINFVSTQFNLRITWLFYLPECATSHLPNFSKWGMLNHELLLTEPSAYCYVRITQGLRMSYPPPLFVETKCRTASKNAKNFAPKVILFWIGCAGFVLVSKQITLWLFAVKFARFFKARERGFAAHSQNLVFIILIHIFQQIQVYKHQLGNWLLLRNPAQKSPCNRHLHQELSYIQVQ